MNEHQIHFGRKFYKDKKTGYWISTDYPRIRAHQWVWINSQCNIPRGLHIHHKDGNKSNNDFSNLTIISPSDHMRNHIISDKKRLAKAKENCEKIRHLTKKWHASEEGKAWHKLHALKNKFGKWEPKKYNCEECGKEFESSKRNRTRFCHNNCKSKWRRKNGNDNVERICGFCENVFLINKYSKTKTCSRKCYLKKRYGK